MQQGVSAPKSNGRRVGKVHLRLGMCWKHPQIYPNISKYIPKQNAPTWFSFWFPIETAKQGILPEKRLEKHHPPQVILVAIFWSAVQLQPCGAETRGTRWRAFGPTSLVFFVVLPPGIGKLDGWEVGGEGWEGEGWEGWEGWDGWEGWEGKELEIVKSAFAEFGGWEGWER